MAYSLERQKTISTPYVYIDEKTGYMKLEGRCFHEKVIEFFKDVDDWLNDYLNSDFVLFTFDCVLEYINSSTTKILYNMLLKMDKHAVNNNKVVVNWITTGGNEIMVECGEDFKEEMENLEFNIILCTRESIAAYK